MVDCEYGYGAGACCEYTLAPAGCVRSTCHTRTAAELGFNICRDVTNSFRQRHLLPCIWGTHMGLAGNMLDELKGKRGAVHVTHMDRLVSWCLPVVVGSVIVPSACSSCDQRRASPQGSHYCAGPAGPSDACCGGVCIGATATCCVTLSGYVACPSDDYCTKDYGGSEIKACCANPALSLLAHACTRSAAWLTPMLLLSCRHDFMVP